MKENPERYLVGVDLGGTKIEGVIIDTKDYSTIVRRRIPTNQHEGYLSIINSISELISSIEREAGISTLQFGIGTPGCIEPSTGLIKNSNTQCLNSKPLLQDIQEATQKEVKMANDANCFALAEFKLGAVKNHDPNAKNAFGVIMGTGVGGGLIIDGKLVAGKHGLGGEWGHNILIPDGPRCYCGKNGCVETIISGPALESYYTEISGDQLSLIDIYKRVTSDNYAQQTIDYLVDNFGKALSTIVNIIDPDAIILGGGVGNILELYTKGFDAVEFYAFNSTLDTKILKPALGDSAGVYGAALLCEKNCA